MSSVSGLSAEHRASARRIILRGVAELLTSPASIHYTQGPQRWQGINDTLRIADGQRLTYGDCSATHSWLIWNALTHVGVDKDLLNDQNWRGGYTGTIAAHGKQVHSLRNAQIGDAILYGPAPTFEHVATYIGWGMVVSHGSENGPHNLSVDYRPDRGLIRRHI